MDSLNEINNYPTDEKSVGQCGDITLMVREQLAKLLVIE